MVRLAAAETWRQHGSPKDHALSRTFAAISSPESTPCRMNAAMRFAGPQVSARTLRGRACGHVHLGIEGMVTGE